MGQETFLVDENIAWISLVKMAMKKWDRGICFGCGANMTC